MQNLLQKAEAEEGILEYGARLRVVVGRGGGVLKGKVCVNQYMQSHHHYHF